MWFFLNLYLQQVLGFGAFEGGAALLPMTVAIMLGMVVVAPRVIARFGVKPPIVAGLLAPRRRAWPSCRWCAPDGSFVVDVLPGSLIAAAGHGAGVHPVARHRHLQSAKPEEGGLASGIVNTSYQVGSALGLAAMTALATAQGADQLGNLAALTDGYSAAFLGAAGIAVAGALPRPRCCARPRQRRPRRPASNRPPACPCERPCAGGPSRPPAHRARRSARGGSADPSSAAGPR